MACTSAPLCNQCAKTCSALQHTKPKNATQRSSAARASFPPNGGGDAQARPHAHPSWPTSAFMLPGRKTRAPCRAAHCSRWSIASVWLGCKRSASSNTSFCARNVVARLRVCCPSRSPSLCSRTRKSFGRPTCAHALPAAHEHQPRRRPTAFLGCTTRGRIRPRQLGCAWQREWEHFASCWAASAALPMSLTFSAYRHVAVALQSGVLLPRAAASATMHASELVSSTTGGTTTTSAIFTSVPALSSALVIIVCMFNTTHARTLFVEQTEGEHAPKENMDGHAGAHAHSHAHNYTHPHQTNAIVHLARCCPACTSFSSPALHSICRTH